MKIAVIGDIIIDEYVHGVVERISPEAPAPILNFKNVEIKHGGALNVFDNIKSLTDNVIMCTRNTSPPRKVRYMSNGHYMLRVDYDECGEWHNDTAEADIVVISDYAKGAIVSFTPYVGLKTIVDPKRDLSFYKGAWCLKPNAKEFSSYAGIWKSIIGLKTSMIEAREELNVSHLIVTLGENGVAYCGPNGIFEILKSEAQEVYDVTGAGDTFTAVLAYACSIEMDMIGAIKLANKAAGISVSHLGTYVITKRDLEINKKVIFTNGCFDILHPGHIEYLKASRKLGDYLIVAINSDESVKRLKGDKRPINNEVIRAYMLTHLSFVDKVIIFDEDTPYEIIKKLKPDVITKGGDYEIASVVGRDLAEVVIIPFVDSYSTTSIIERIQND